MTFRIIDELSRAGNIRNEDFYAYSHNAVLLLDGSSGLTGTAPDACRFVKEYAELFMKNIAETANLCETINSSIRELETRYKSEGVCVGGGLLPSAALLAMYLREGKLQVITVGDCTALIKSRKGITSLYRDEVEKFDSAVKNEAVRIREQTGEDICDIMRKPHIREMLYSNRLKMNAPDGYEILAFNMRERNAADVMEFDVSDICEIVIFSDGFEAKYSELHNNTPSLAELYMELREEEQSDSRLNLNPRFKISDDATALVIKIV